MTADDVVAGFLYRSEAEPERDKTVCKIKARAYDEIHGDGGEPTFLVEFSDGSSRVVRAERLSPWYPL